ncbi:hypothetical protein GWK47_008046 [Chionoecetes opilio]|uniref:Uncharacterized protein n=1 Tax=Chionoecetes opilio TaxID=41210 RepID=A0A8J5CP09_CHIOP|nr:hypothetical protein GWK47_008046 [Chionoecetes opilio]
MSHDVLLSHDVLMSHDVLLSHDVLMFYTRYDVSTIFLLLLVSLMFLRAPVDAPDVWYVMCDLRTACGPRPHPHDRSDVACGLSTPCPSHVLIFHARALVAPIVVCSCFFPANVSHPDPGTFCAFLRAFLPSDALLRPQRPMRIQRGHYPARRLTASSAAYAHSARLLPLQTAHRVFSGLMRI